MLTHVQKSTGSNTHTITVVCSCEEGAIVPNKWKKMLELQYYEKDDYPSLTTCQNNEPHEW